MSSVTVSVCRSGSIIAKIERPLHEVDGALAVVYKRRMWQLHDNSIDLDLGPIENDSDDEDVVSETGPVTTNSSYIPVPENSDDAELDDDGPVREDIVCGSADTRMLVEAGPGTGKTEMAARRLENLLRHHVSAGEILVLSFSRSAVRTLTSRLAKDGVDEYIVEELRHVAVRTFDSWTFRMLRRLGYQPSQLLSGTHDANIALLVEETKGKNRDRLRELIGDRKHLIIDEFQDLPGVRGDLVLALLDLLAPPRASGVGFTILGDPAQAIYSFAAGKRPDGSDFPTPREYWDQVVGCYGEELELKTLTRNHRATTPLARLSVHLRSVLLGEHSDEVRLNTVLHAISELPESAHAISPEFVPSTQPGTRAILTRTNGEAMQVLKSLLGQETAGPETPVRFKAGHCSVLPPAWISGLLSRLKSQNLPRSQFSAIYTSLTTQWGSDKSRALGLPAEEIGWKRLSTASGQNEHSDSISVSDLRERMSWPDSFPDDQSPSEHGLVVTTVHQSKGMEFDIVTLLDETVADREKDDSDRLARANVGYVGITRAGRELNRAPRTTYDPLQQWAMKSGRQRLGRRWHTGWINLEIGLPCDIDPLGFVDPGLHGSSEAVAELQNFFLLEAAGLEGRKVMLCSKYDDGKVYWHIHLQDENRPGRLIGRTTEQLTRDLFSVLDGKYKLPSRILNLRVSSVGSICGMGDVRIFETEGESRMWLGISLIGTGDFRTVKKSKNA